MSSFGLHFPKKLKTLSSSTNKAWHSLTSSLRPKLRHLRRLKRRPFRQKPPSGGSHYSYYKSYKHQYIYEYQHLRHQSSGANSPATVYVDRLYGDPSSSRSGKNADVAMRAADVAEKKGKEGGGSGGGGWKEYISSLPKIKGVDERAEEFISKFRQQMQLQRQQSILDFSDMLARSS